MISVIRIYILYLHAVLIKQQGPTSHYMLQVSNMFTVNFIFCPSKSKFLETYLALEMSLSNA